jgi:Coenzyme PQQ synthesis protein D (PqqD)
LETYDDHSISTNFMPGSHINSYPMEDELLLFDEQTKQMLRMNPTATAIWKGCRAGLPLKEITAALSDATGVAIEQIAYDVNHIISHWLEMGLLHDSREPLLRRKQSVVAEEPLDAVDYDGPVPQLPPVRHEYKFRILDTCFQLSVPIENELHLVTPLLAHLSVPYETVTDQHLHIVRADDRYVLMHNKKVINWCFHISGIAPMLYGHSLLIAYELSHCLFGLHAAAVFWQGKCVLMPALSGSGKSTLTAALVGSGASLCADDLVLLTPAPVRMRPVPVVIGLKNGSWDLLASYHPNIASLPIHLRSDEKYIRYLVPPADALVPMTSQPFPIDLILFPKFVDGGDAAVLTEISAADGLCQLTDAGYDVRGEMTAPCVNQLVDWITHIPCYEMQFNQLDKAVYAIQTLVS